MGKKKSFIDRKNCQRFRLVPDTRDKSEKFQPTEEHLAEQQKYGVYYDDDYDYMQHMRAINEPMKLETTQEEEEVEKFTVKHTTKPSFPPAPPLFGLVGENKPKDFVDHEIAEVLDGEVNDDGNLEDDFVALAGGIVDQKVSFYRGRTSQESDEEEDDEEPFDYDDEELFGEEATHEINPDRDNLREIDDAFEQILDREYNIEQIGELDGDDYAVGGCLEPADGRLQKLVNEKKGNNSEYDEDLAKHYVRERMRLIEAGVIKEKEETEVVEVDESTRKRMKWDCESFATQYTNIYNHPTLIREPRGGLSKALKKFNKEIEEMDIEEDDEDEDCEDDDMDSQVTGVSTFRPKGETAEQRKLRKQAVKEAKRARRVEKKANKTAFAEEGRKLAKGRIGQIKARPI